MLSVENNLHLPVGKILRNAFKINLSNVTFKI